MPYFAGITDEAGGDLATQIRATQEIGWQHLELRNVRVNGGQPTNVHDLPEDEFEALVAQISDAGLRVSCFSSAVANWGKPIDEDMRASLAEAERCLPRMKALGTQFVRIMSFRLLEDEAGHTLPPDKQLVPERIRRLQELVDLFQSEGLQPVHENCMNYGGMGSPQTLELIEAVPGLQLVFDTGNPVFTDDFTRPAPRPKQDALEFYENVRDHIAYVHIKDGIWNPERKKADFTFPGDGQGKVREILGDLKARGYDGGISIEPHMASVFHDEQTEPGSPEAQFQTFCEYGRRLETLWHSL